MDVGSWPAYGGTLSPDAAGCATNARATHADSTNVLAVSDDPAHTITTIGCRDLIVVHTTDATLICPTDRAEDVKNLVDAVDKDLR